MCPSVPVVAIARAVTTGGSVGHEALLGNNLVEGGLVRKKYFGRKMPPLSSHVSAVEAAVAILSIGYQLVIGYRISVGYWVSGISWVSILRYQLLVEFRIPGIGYHLKLL